MDENLDQFCKLQFLCTEFQDIYTDILWNIYGGPHKDPICLPHPFAQYCRNPLACWYSDYNREHEHVKNEHGLSLRQLFTSPLLYRVRLRQPNLP
jgi:hypothetical protein